MTKRENLKIKKQEKRNNPSRASCNNSDIANISRNNIKSSNRRKWNNSKSERVKGKVWTRCRKHRYGIRKSI